MTKIRDEVLEANAKYAEEFGARGKLPIVPARGIAILTCMDSRINTFALLGLAEGDAHVIRNAGGRASDDAIRSLIVSYKLLGTREWLVIHHTKCGQELFTDEVMRNLLASSLETARWDGKQWQDTGKGPGSVESDYIDWLTIRNLNDSVNNDVQRIRRHPLVPASIAIHGFIFDVETGRLSEVTKTRP